MTDILSVSNLETSFKTQDGRVYAVNGVSFSLKEGETLGVVGESGCGKSVTMLSVMGLIAVPPGKVSADQLTFLGKDLLSMTKEEIRALRGSQMSMIFQDPMTSFNPVLTIGKQITEPLVIHRGLSQRDANRRAAEMLALVGIPNPQDRLSDYPHQFSGGMRQRAMIAMALVCDPKMLIADEPTTALDVTIQAQLLDLIRRLRGEMGMSIIWITHDLGIIAGLAQRVIVMYGGYIIEEAPVKDLYANPCHPYTLGLLNSLPRMNEMGRRRLESIEGLPPVLFEKPAYCPFKDRCRFVFDHCRTENPPLKLVGDRHFAACWLDLKTGRERL